MTEVSVQKSTNVRFYSGAALKLLRALFHTLEQFAPGPGARLAVRLWCTPPRGRPGGAGRAAPGGSEPFTVRVEGRAVAAQTWGSGPIVYLVHGWGGRRGQLDGFVAPLVAAGHRVVSFDALSHGESAAGSYGRRSTLPEFAGTIAAVVRATGPAHGIVAHSLGGTAAAIAVLDGLEAQRLVLVAALADAPSYTREFGHALGFGERIRTGLLRDLERLVGQPLSAFDVPSRVARTPGSQLPPLLVVHDRDDKEARYADATAIAAAWSGAELATTVGLGHRRILADTGVIDRAVAYVSASSTEKVVTP